MVEATVERTAVVARVVPMAVARVVATVVLTAEVTAAATEAVMVVALAGGVGVVAEDSESRLEDLAGSSVAVTALAATVRVAEVATERELIRCTGTNRSRSHLRCSRPAAKQPPAGVVA